MKLDKYSYKPYENVYPVLFELEKKRLLKKLPSGTRIEHIGSSAVSGLGGKGIVDIYVAATKDNFEKVSRILQEQLKYEFRPGGGDEKRKFFRRYETDTAGKLRICHLHLGDMSNPNFIQSIALRDYLRAHPPEANRYNKIKQKASKEALKETDLDDQERIYKKVKSQLIEELNNKAINWYQKSK